MFDLAVFITWNNLKQNEAQNTRAGINTQDKLINVRKMPLQHANKDPSRLRWFSPGMRVNTRYINETPSELLPWVLIYLRIEKKRKYVQFARKMRTRNCQRYTRTRKWHIHDSQSDWQIWNVGLCQVVSHGAVILTRRRSDTERLVHCGL